MAPACGPAFVMSPPGLRPAPLPSARQPRLTVRMDAQGLVSRRGALLALSVILPLAVLGEQVLGGRSEADAGAQGTGTGRPLAGPSVLPQPERLVAIGDLHGDLPATRRVLRVAGVLHPERDEWAGGKTVVVQVGDQLDRGDQELEVLGLLHKLQIQAEAAGGAFHVMLGNHETLTAADQMMYGTKGAFLRFGEWSEACSETPAPEDSYCELLSGSLECNENDAVCNKNIAQGAVPPWAMSRYLALRRGGLLAREVLAKERRTVLVVGDTVFVHAGLIAAHLDGSGGEARLNAMNNEMAKWVAGDPGVPQPVWANGQDGALWTRKYSMQGKDVVNYDGSTCSDLEQVLSMLPGHVTRMVVGHTPQPRGANEVCNGGVWRIDVGLSKGVLGGKAQVLEILPGGRVRVLREGEGPGPWFQESPEFDRTQRSMLDRLISAVTGRAGGPQNVVAMQDAEEF